MFSEERQQRIQERIQRLLADIDPDVHLHGVILDSTRQQLAFVMQKGEWPVVLGMNYLDYVSHRDEQLKKQLEEGLKLRLQAALERQMREEEE